MGLLLFTALFSLNTSASNTQLEEVVRGYYKGETNVKYAFEEAESNMYLNAFDICAPKLAIRTSKIKQVDVSYIIFVSANFICLEKK